MIQRLPTTFWTCGSCGRVYEHYIDSGPPPTNCPSCGKPWTVVKTTGDSNLGAAIGCLGAIVSLIGLILAIIAMKDIYTADKRIVFAVASILCVWLGLHLHYKVRPRFRQTKSWIRDVRR